MRKGHGECDSSMDGLDGRQMVGELFFFRVHNLIATNGDDNADGGRHHTNTDSNNSVKPPGDCFGPSSILERSIDRLGRESKPLPSESSKTSMRSSNVVDHQKIRFFLPGVRLTITDTQELVVPRSIPITSPASVLFHRC